ncbi:arp2/3 complex-activating protein rickA-like [Helianthus annuus]|uniref:arp2/3 complex-activating protein rickA-like n=1 Tax=Helianthus annuus TaxID=4232 RepID=UPI000B8FA8D3|nr:arp2/3 complex-activating protein rickA-like [Helianthus annuus]
MEMDDDPDPMPPTGTPTHPISISSGSPYEGSPYQGPDSWAKRCNTYQWEFTPSFHNSPPQPPLEEPYLQAVTPPPLPIEEPPQQPPQPPPEPPRRRRNAWIVQIVAGSDEVNSHPVEGNNNDTRINVTGAELQAMIDTTVAQAVDKMFKEPSNVRSKTHTKPLSHSHTSKKDNSRHLSNQKSEPQRKIVVNQAPKYNKGCTYK